LCGRALRGEEVLGEHITERITRDYHEVDTDYRCEQSEK